MGNLNQKVLKFATDHLNSRVRHPQGDGECWDLAERALESAGAQDSDRIMGSRLTSNADYIWGTVVSNIDTIRPGDILQFRNFETTRRVTQADGSFAESSQNFGHHTAIVASTVSNNMVTILHQNFNGQMRTHRLPIVISAGSRQQAGATITTTVSGTVRAYRPRP